MIRPGVAKRYARALYDIGRENGESERYAVDLNVIAHALKAHAELADYVVNPLVTGDEKRAHLRELFSEVIAEPSQNLLDVLVAAGREAYIAQIAEAYQRIYALDQGILDAVIESAVALSDDEVQAISQSLTTGTVKAVRCQVVVNPKLIGGLRLKLGDRVIDLSVVGRLEQFHKAVTERRIS